MASIEKKAKKDLEVMGKKVDSKKNNNKGTRDDIEAEDDHESFFKWIEENPNAGVDPNAADDNGEQDIEYDDEGNIIVPERSKIIDPLPPIDHSTIEYEPFEKNFYEEHEDIKNLTNEQVDDLRNKLGIKVSGFRPHKPVCSFGHYNFDDGLLRAISKANFTQPTPIQSQAIPCALSGRDIIGIAKTGSGKTDAFVWPALVHIMDQRELEPGDGPIVLILAPTRELAQQIYAETKKFAKVYNIKCACAYGGGSLYEQTLACQEGVEILVCTPGRLIDLVKKKGTNLHRVTYLVLDEADRMFDMGFEPQVRSIADHVRPNRQTLLFSATFKKKVEKLAREILSDPVRIIQGELGEANENIEQIVRVFTDGAIKWQWIIERLVEFTTTGKVIIFVTQKANACELAKNLMDKEFKLGLLHGDMHQDDRNKVITEFKNNKEITILVATDVAARGLDIPSIKTVVNYDIARDIDTHTHRIGRTGRAGDKGVAYTLVTPKDKEFTPHLVRNLESANQQVPNDLLDLALQVIFNNKKIGKIINE
jgi:ATP-dependent RNA helicase DDX42